MPTFPQLIAALAHEDGLYRTEAPEDWAQGRTIYGGLSAALCAAAAARAVSDLPPLRSAQFCFVGPAAGSLRARPRVLRRGRSAIIVGVDLEAEAGLATRAILTYGTRRDSRIAHDHLPAPAVPPPDGCTGFFGEGMPPNFARNFEMRLAAGSRLFTAGAPAFTMWVRHRAEGDVDSYAALLALADAPPPAAMVQFNERGPISTMTWGLELVNEPRERGWRLLSLASERAADGYSCQTLTVWSESGMPLAVGRQTVALFA